MRRAESDGVGVEFDPAEDSPQTASKLQLVQRYRKLKAEGGEAAEAAERLRDPEVCPSVGDQIDEAIRLTHEYIARHWDPRDELGGE